MRKSPFKLVSIPSINPLSPDTTPRYKTLIPRDLLWKLFSMLPIRDICNCFRVCKEWKRMSKSMLFWQHLLGRDYPYNKSVFKGSMGRRRYIELFYHDQLRNTGPYRDFRVIRRPDRALIHCLMLEKRFVAVETAIIEKEVEESMLECKLGDLICLYYEDNHKIFVWNDPGITEEIGLNLTYPEFPILYWKIVVPGTNYVNISSEVLEHLKNNIRCMSRSDFKLYCKPFEILVDAHLPENIIFSEHDYGGNGFILVPQRAKLRTIKTKEDFVYNLSQVLLFDGNISNMVLPNVLFI